MVEFAERARWAGGEHSASDILVFLVSLVRRAYTLLCVPRGNGGGVTEPRIPTAQERTGRANGRNAALWSFWRSADGIIFFFCEEGKGRSDQSALSRRVSWHRKSYAIACLVGAVRLSSL